MKIVIGNMIIDADKEPIMIMLNENDKRNIANMDENCFNYICYPKSFQSDHVIQWAKKFATDKNGEYSIKGAVNIEEIEKL